MSVKFGDIFSYREKDYVFLTKTEDIIYASEILDPLETKQIKSFAEREINKNKTGWEKRIIFCYTILRTEEYKDRMAHFKNSSREAESLSIETLGYSLEKRDLEEIKKEILDGPLPGELKELVRDIEIK